jgi:hypothetical protein
VPFSGVTNAISPINLASISGAQKATRRPLQMTFGGYTVVPNPDWPAMLPEPQARWQSYRYGQPDEATGCR